jgi:Flp pilus assembly protein TadD
LLGEVAATAAEASLLFPRRQALAHYAGALLAAGQVDRAAEVVAEASEVPAEDVRSRVVTLRVRAAVLLAQGRRDDARLALDDALRVASSTESRSEVPATERALAGIPA